jgi:RNA polymerase-binding transcription factor DksA
VTDSGNGDEFQDEQRTGLEGQRAQLETTLAEMHVDDLAETQDSNFADGGQVAAEQDEIMALANDLRGQLDDVQHALGKLDSGAYGVCEVCGEAIPDDRLAALPATRFCMQHAG